MAKISKTTIAKVSEMYRDGFSTREIADALDLSEATVVHILGL